MIKKLFLTTLIVGTSALPSTLFACEEGIATTSKKVIVSEIYPSPADGEEEFIEIYNGATKKINIEGWTLTDASGKKYVFDSKDVKTVMKKGTHLTVPQSVSKIFLNNGSDSITLQQANGKKRSFVSYVDAVSGQSWSFISSVWEWSSPTKGAGNKSTSQSTAVAPGENPTSSSLQTSKDIFLSEMLPDPEGSDTTDEWIEIVNTGKETVNVEGWRLQDSSKTYTIKNSVIAPGQYLQFSVVDTGVSLNNSGETIELLDPFEVVIDSTTYPDSDTAMAWARFSGEWKWTSALTPGAENVLTQGSSDEEQVEGEESEETGSETDVLSISEFRLKADDESGSIEGVVTVVPGVLGEQYFYIQDDTAGMQVYSYDKDFPEMTVGDHVTVTGTKSQTRNETRIKTESAADIQINGTADIKTHEVTALQEEQEGMLVSFSGTLTEKSSTELLIDGVVPVVIKSGVVLPLDSVEEGDPITISGILGQSNDEYRILPRGDHDLSDSSSFAASTSEQSGSDTASLQKNDSLNGSFLDAGQESQKNIFFFFAAALAVLSVALYRLWQHPPFQQFLMRHFPSLEKFFTQEAAPKKSARVDAVEMPLPPVKQIVPKPFHSSFAPIKKE